MSPNIEVIIIMEPWSKNVKTAAPFPQLSKFGNQKFLEISNQAGPHKVTENLNYHKTSKSNITIIWKTAQRE